MELCWDDLQARMQVLGLEGVKFGDGSGDLGGPQSGPGRSPGGGTRGRFRGLQILHLYVKFTFPSRYRSCRVK